MTTTEKNFCRVYLKYIKRFNQHKTKIELIITLNQKQEFTEKRSKTEKNKNQSKSFNGKKRVYCKYGNDHQCMNNKELLYFWDQEKQ